MLIRGQEIDYHLVQSNKELDALLDILSALDIVAVDTETYPDESFGPMASGLDPHTSFLRMIQFNWITNKEPYILDFKKLVISERNWEGLKAFFIGNVRKVAHNATFEINILRKTLGIRSNGFECTKVDMQLIGGATGSKSSKLRGYSYASLCRDYLDVHVDKTEQTSDWGREELSSQQLEYAALDVGAPKDSPYCSLLLEAHKLMSEVLTSLSPQQEKDSNGYNMEFVRNEIDQKAMAVVAGIQYVGNPVNKAVFDSIYSSLSTKVNSLKIELCRELGFAVNPRMTLVNGKPTRVYEVNDTTSKLLNSPKGLVKHVKSVLGSKGIVLDDLKAESLEKIIYNLENESDDPNYQEEEDEFLLEEEQKLRDIKLVNLLLDYKGAVKMLGSDYRKVINPFTGCIHAQYQTIGAATGQNLCNSYI